jgi:solute carrier family 25 (mitochondrial citrate transporter), member 1
VIKQASNQGIRFFFFSEYKRLIIGSESLTPLQSFGGGMFAGTMSVLGNNPVDVTKTRMQSMDASRYAGSWDCAKSIMRKEGFLAFYKGTLARLARVVPGQVCVCG